MKYDWDNGAIKNGESSQKLELELIYPDISAHFPGIVLEREVETEGSAVAELVQTIYQEHRKVEKNVGENMPDTEATITFANTTDVDILDLSSVYVDTYYVRT